MDIPEGYGQANLHFRGAAAPQGAQTTIGFLVGDVGRTPTSAAEAIFSAFRQTLVPIMASSIELWKCTVKFGPTIDGPSGEFTGSFFGGGVEASVSPNVCALVSKVTASGGRKGRGRMFLPGITENQVDSSGLITGQNATGWNTQLESFRATMVGAQLPPQLLHSPDKFGAITNPLPITQLRLTGKVATQRRRLR